VLADRIRRVGRALIGALPFLLMALVVKLSAPPNDLTRPNFGRVFSLDSHIMIAASFAHFTLLMITPLALSIWIVRERRKLPQLLLLPTTLLAVYYVVYLTTPYDLAWHLAFSVDRLLLHMWPTVLYFVFVSINAASSRERK
jgi:hypothetical protein